MIIEYRLEYLKHPHFAVVCCGEFTCSDAFRRFRLAQEGLGKRVSEVRVWRY